jgi:Tol biopolymer transport system component
MKSAPDVSPSASLDGKTIQTPLLALTEFAQNRSLGYPHCNVFTRNGRYMVVASEDENTSALWRLDLSSGEEKKICEFKRSERMTYYDLAEDGEILVVTTSLALWLYRLDDCSLLATHYPALNDGYQVDHLPSITADGRDVVVGISQDGRYSGYHLDVASGKGRVLFEKAWHANHFHFSPRDRNWIAFSHEGRADQISDRMWAWHSTLAPEGKCVFDQASTGVAPFLVIGHERWCFHDTSAVVVAFAGNPVLERGVYEVYLDGRAARQVYQGSALHANISPDGRWLVVDTLGPYDTMNWTEGPPPGPWPWGLHSDVVVVDRKTGARRLVAPSLIGNCHPAHPHPAFSPDGRYIFFNEAEADPDRKRCRVMCARNPLWTEPVSA